MKSLDRQSEERQSADRWWPSKVCGCGHPIYVWYKVIGDARLHPRHAGAHAHTRAERGYLLDDVRERKEHAAEAWLLLRRASLPGGRTLYT